MRINGTRLKTFNALGEVQTSYVNYVETFQNVDDDTIGAWIDEWINTGMVLWKELYFQLNERVQTGRSSQRIRPSDNHQKCDHHEVTE